VEERVRDMKFVWVRERERERAEGAQMHIPTSVVEENIDSLLYQRLYTVGKQKIEKVFSKMLE
jgi:hypothetical protein